ncbi:hypothetical protein Bca4012_077366 [Brassica carinata]
MSSKGEDSSSMADRMVKEDTASVIPVERKLHPGLRAYRRLNVCIVRVPADHKTKSQKESEGEQLSGETCGCSKGWRMTAAAVWPETRECVPKREEVSEDDDARSCVSILVSFKAQADS